jgi:hypothetical protein
MCFEGSWNFMITVPHQSIRGLDSNAAEGRKEELVCFLFCSCDL